ncbi:MAG: hypothetical protein B7733_24415 [Myxococcales bacterium FL481]|nr:MAG: hypothetical protein B7733_24415 [Myxococcales bacterium FL481]
MRLLADVGPARPDAAAARNRLHRRQLRVRVVTAVLRGLLSSACTEASSRRRAGTDAGPLRLHTLFAPGDVFEPQAGSCSCHAGQDPLATARLNLATPARAWASLTRSPPATTGFPLVAPRRPSSSHLLHVLLRQADGRALRGVLGHPMPPDEPLRYPEIVTIARWIAHGARLN